LAEKMNLNSVLRLLLFVDNFFIILGGADRSAPGVYVRSRQQRRMEKASQTTVILEWN